MNIFFSNKTYPIDSNAQMPRYVQINFPAMMNGTCPLLSIMLRVHPFLYSILSLNIEITHWSISEEYMNDQEHNSCSLQETYYFRLGLSEINASSRGYNCVY